MSAPRTGTAIGIALAATCSAMLGGCATLGGNVKGDFACRAPAGICAPTSTIDEAATGLAQASTGQPAPAFQATAQPGGRSLRIVVAGYRDAAGRTHDPRVVHVVLPDRPGDSWRAPVSTGDVIRALARTGSPAAPGAVPAHRPADAQPQTNSNPHLPPLPDVLVTPSQAAPEKPGAPAPVTGAPGRPPSPGRVSQPYPQEGDPE